MTKSNIELIIEKLEEINKIKEHQNGLLKQFAKSLEK